MNADLLKCEANLTKGAELVIFLILIIVTIIVVYFAKKYFKNHWKV